MTVDVTFDHQSTPRHCDIAIELTDAFMDGDLPRLETFARACPVRRSLEPAVTFMETITCAVPHG